MLGAKRKKPGDNLDYDIYFTDWLVDGDSLVTASAVADDNSITIGTVQVIPPLVKIWISGGTAGKSYKITVTTTTAAGRVKEVDFIVRVTEC